MPRIVSLSRIDSIKPGSPPNISPDGTILNPEPYVAVEVIFENGAAVQVGGDPELLTAQRITAVLAKRSRAKIGKVTVGDNISDTESLISRWFGRGGQEEEVQL